METINLKDFYSSLYSNVCFYEVPEEIEELLELFKRQMNLAVRWNVMIF